MTTSEQLDRVCRFSRSYRARPHIDLKVLRRLVKEEEGAALVEYGLLVGLIACACVAVLTTLGKDISSLFNAIAGKITAITIP